MQSISSWLFSIIGIILIGSLIDSILPNGKIGKYIKYCYSFIVVFVIVNPLLSIYSKINTDIVSDDYINYEYLDKFNNNSTEFLQQNIEKVCETYGLKNVKINILSYFDEKEYKIQSIQVYLGDLVIEEKNKHIDKYQILNDILVARLKVEKEQIIYYE